MGSVSATHVHMGIVDQSPRRRLLRLLHRFLCVLHAKIHALHGHFHFLHVKGLGFNH